MKLDKDGSCIPAELRHVFAGLDSVLNERDRAWLSRLADDSLVYLHFSLGLYIRNTYEYRDTTTLGYFIRRGVRNPDDMSGVILRTYQEHLRGECPDMRAAIAGIPAVPPAPSIRGLAEVQLVNR